MSDAETHATPPSGMLAGDTILTALDGIRTEIRQTREESRKRGEETSARLERLEETAGYHARALERLTNEVTAHSKQIEGIVEAQASTAKAASIAAELSAQALQRVNSAQDDAKKMVESAMQIQRGAIAAEVSAAVEPIRVNDARQDRIQRAFCEVLGIDYDTVSTPPPKDEATARALAKRPASKVVSFTDLAKRNKHATGASLLTLAIIIAEIVLRAMGSGGRGVPYGRE